MSFRSRRRIDNETILGAVGSGNVILMDETDFGRWVARARAADLLDEDIAKLAESLAASGERFQALERSADLASTGGPGSLSTLWAPAILAASGYKVPKLGVPGRPAGGVDVLAQVPGYRVNLNRIEAKAVLDDCGYVHLLAGNHFAPADAAMFAYRQRVGAGKFIPEASAFNLLAIELRSSMLSLARSRLSISLRPFVFRPALCVSSA